jgi:hypothetical protein
MFGSDAADMLKSHKFSLNTTANMVSENDYTEQANSYESVTHEFNKQMNEDPEMRAAFEEMMLNQITS